MGSSGLGAPPSKSLPPESPWLLGVRLRVACSNSGTVCAEFPVVGDGGAGLVFVGLAAAGSSRDRKWGVGAIITLSLTYRSLTRSKMRRCRGAEACRAVGRWFPCCSLVFRMCGV